MNRITILPSQDVFETIKSVNEPVTMTMLDPWYNKGVGGVRDDYKDWLTEVVRNTSDFSTHIFIWGFPEIIYFMLDRLPKGFELVTWLTWYYKNCPTTIRGWRSAQLTCLHIAQKGAKLYPEHFFNAAQQERFEQGKMRYIPGPTSVIEAALNIGFVGKSEQTGHPAQKPLKVIEPLVLMTTKEDDLVLDPMCGAGTTGIVCNQLNRRAILSDHSEQYTELARDRLERVNYPKALEPIGVL